MHQQRWKNRPAGSNWGDFGADDQLGRLNLIDAAALRRGVAEVRDCVSLCLSLPLDYPGGNSVSPRRHPPVLSPTQRDGRPVYNLQLGQIDPTHAHFTEVICDDSVLLHTQYSTQWDSLAHVGHLFDANGDGVAEAVYYNGFRAGEDIIGPGDAQGRAVGARRLGIETMAQKAIQTRGVLVNLQQIYGAARHYVGYDDLMRAMERQGAAVESGDILCLYTGYADALLGMNRQPDAKALEAMCAVLDGSDGRLQNWIVDSGVAAIAADNFAVEGIPSSQPDHHCRLPLHELCLFRLGLPLGELWHLAELASHLGKQGRCGFLLTAPPLRLTGAVGSPVTPVATL
jgi:kynurenine formamidase